MEEKRMYVAGHRRVVGAAALQAAGRPRYHVLTRTPAGLDSEHRRAPCRAPHAFFQVAVRNRSAKASC